VIAAAYIMMGDDAAPASPVPTLVLHGELDDTLPLHNAHALAHAFSADLVVLPGVHHNVFHEAPHAVEAALLAWLARRVPRACVADDARGMVFLL
jgi:pimeloyl-ACP methyl ester carboxylesterase